MNNTYITNLNWRYATDDFDSSRKLSTEQLEMLLEVLRLTPSSFGLQLWKFYVVENQTMREQIKEASWGQIQPTEASHLILLASRKGVNDNDINDYIKSISEQRSVSMQDLEGFKTMLLGFKQDMSNEALNTWSAKQIYIALGFLLFACAQNQIDSCPMEGFDKQKVTEIIGAREEGYEVQLMCPVGFRLEKENPRKTKVRYPKSKITKVIS
jgi:nitroreductase / dihydropteridine reductase